MTFIISNNNKSLYESSLVYLVKKCKLQVDRYELTRAYKRNSYLYNDESLAVYVPILEDKRKYKCEFNGIIFDVHEIKSNKIFVAHMNNDIIDYTKLHINLNELSFLQFTKDVLIFEENLYGPQNDSLIHHFVCNEYCGWEKNDSYTKRSKSTLYLRNEIKSDLFSDVNNFYNNPIVQKFYEKMCIPQSRIYLFYGYPGTGKTTSCYTIASELGLNIGTIDFTNSIDDCKLRKSIKNLPEKTILLLEDLDHLFDPPKESDNLRHSITFSGLLNSLDGINKVKKLICIITCNNIDSLEKPLLRRIDYSVRFENIIYEDQITEFSKEIQLKFNKQKFVIFFKNKQTTINIIQKWILLHLNNFLSGKYCIDDKLEEFNEFNKWYISHNQSQANLYN
jgi:DNA polymerase III delta prime subunit